MGPRKAVCAAIADIVRPQDAPGKGSGSAEIPGSTRGTGAVQHLLPQGLDWSI